MKKLGLAGLLFVLGLFIILGFNYSENNYNRAEAEPVKTDAEQEASQVNHNQVPPVTPPVTTPSEIQNNEPSVSVKPAYYIDVNITEQKVRIYENDLLIKEWSASTGENNSTPLGKFKIQNRGDWFFSEKYQQGATWWVSFKDWGVYLFHSVPMDREKNIIPEEASKLGSPASHGCVRLQVENARWIYENIPQGTDVYIHA